MKRIGRDCRRVAASTASRSSPSRRPRRSAVAAARAAACATARRSRPSVDEVVGRAKAFIAENACRRGGLDQNDVAGELGISVRTLQLRFKEYNPGRTVLQEIQCVQLESVRKALEKTSDSIETITFASGFGSLSRLKVLFRKTYGKSMREWRLKHKK